MTDGGNRVGKKEKVRNICRLLLVYAGLYLIGTVMFIGLFHTKLCKNIDVLMYRGILFLVISSVAVTLGMWGFKHFGRMHFISVRDIILLFCMFCCVNFTLFTLIPVTVERSISVFMLSYMEENDSLGWTQEEVEDVFVSKYIKDYGAFEKRFHEQLETGSIVEGEDGKYRITGRGKRIVHLFRIVANIFHTDQRLVYPNEN